MTLAQDAQNQIHKAEETGHDPEKPWALAYAVWLGQKVWFGSSPPKDAVVGDKWIDQLFDTMRTRTEAGWEPKPPGPQLVGR